MTNVRIAFNVPFIAHSIPKIRLETMNICIKMIPLHEQVPIYHKTRADKLHKPWNLSGIRRPPHFQQNKITIKTACRAVPSICGNDGKNFVYIWWLWIIKLSFFIQSIWGFLNSVVLIRILRQNIGQWYIVLFVAKTCDWMKWIYIGLLVYISIFLKF